MARDIEAGRAFIKLMLTGRAQVQSQLHGIGSQMKSMAALAGRLTAAIGAIGIGAGIIASIKAASDMQQTMDQFNDVFGESADVVKDWGDELASSVGRSKKQVASFLATTQMMLTTMGVGADRAKEMSQQITRLAIDLASFANVSDEQAFADIEAALTGATRGMKKYGVVLTEAQIKQELLNEALDPATATQAQKAYATLQVVLRATAAAQGDAARNLSTFEGQWKRLQATIADVAVEIGNKFLPVATQLVMVLGDAIGVLADMALEQKKGSDGFGDLTIKTDALIGSLGVVVDVLHKVAASVNFVVAGFYALKSVLADVIALNNRLSPLGALLGDPDKLAASARKASIDAQKFLSRGQQGMSSDFSSEFESRLRRVEEERELEKLRINHRPLVGPPLPGAQDQSQGNKLDQIKKSIDTLPQRHVAASRTETLEKGTIEAARKAAENAQRARDEKTFAEIRKQTGVLEDIRDDLDDTDTVEVLNE